MAHQLRIAVPILLLAALGCRTNPPASDTRVAVEGTMGQVRTRAEIDAYVGHEALRCVPATARDELCTWLLTGRDLGWRPLALTIPTSDRLNLLCVVPVDGGPRLPTSCSVHPRRSDRRRWSPPPQSGKRTRGAVLDRSTVRDEMAETARRQLAEAADLAELSRLVGDAPDTCFPSSGAQTCVWRATAQTEGHGLLAASIDASMQKKVRLTCVLSLGGEPRAPDSCAVIVGD